MPVRLSLSPDRQGEWRISLDDTCIVCFSGPSAREQALRRSHEIAALLNERAEIVSDQEQGETARFTTRG